MSTLGRSVVAEFIGSFFLIIAAIASTILPVDILKSDAALAVFMNAIAVAFVLIALIEMFGSISGGHLNPAVTMSFLLSKEITKKKAACYIGAQIAGGFIGVMATHAMFYDITPTLLVVSENTKTPGMYFAEFIGTFLLVAVILGCIKRGSKFAGLSVGAVVGGMLMSTSSTMYANPAVTLARVFTYAICGIAPTSAIFFIVAEFVGALMATMTFSYLYPRKLGDRSIQLESAKSIQMAKEQ
jgi:glycerol uptake facilitator-like aquaporin